MPSHSIPEITAAHKVALGELCRALACNTNGLSSAEAHKRLERFGPNELHENRKTPEWLRFLRQFANRFALLLLIGSALAFAVEHLDPGKGNLYIAVALICVVVLNGIFTYIQEYQSEKILQSFRRLIPDTVAVLRDGVEREIEAKAVVPGDVVFLQAGDRVPADGRILETALLKVDLSSLTGESEPSLRHLECTSENLLESRNLLFSGTLVQSGRGKMLVYATGMHTQFGQIAHLTKATEGVETPLHRELRRFIRIISYIAMSIGILFFGIGLAIGNGVLGSLIFGIGIIVANVPEGLLPTVTLALSMTSKRMAKKNAVIKNLESVETLGSTTTICTDKTGTLTQNRMTVHTLVFDGEEISVWDRGSLDHPNLEVAWQVMALCNNAFLQDAGCVGDPTEGALLVYANRVRTIAALRDAVRIHERPFDSSVKRMMTVCRFPQGSASRAFLKGSPESVAKLCDRILIAGRDAALGAEQRRTIEETYARLARRGERVLALAYRDTDEGDFREEHFVWVGLVGMSDPPRPEVPEAIRKCKEAGIRVLMITGDASLTAEVLARQVGLLEGAGAIVTGDELAALSDEALAVTLTQPEIIFARTSPTQKLRIVKALQAQGEIVTLTGDGVNDAPALKNADMGVAMGIAGTDIAKEASKMILLDDNFSTIVMAIEEGRTVFGNIQKFIAYILTSNVPEILPFIAYVLLGIPLPLTIVLILAIDLGTDLLPALGLGAEAPEQDVMKQPPRAQHHRLLTRNLLITSYGIVGMIEAAAGFAAYFFVLFDGGWRWGDSLAATDPLYRTAVTAFFAAVVICQIANVMICRTQHSSLLSMNWFANRWIWVGIVVEIGFLLLLSYWPALNLLFATAPLQPIHFLPGIPFALAIFLWHELRRTGIKRGNTFALRWLAW